MYKKIAFTLILVFSLFITKDAFAEVILSQTDDTSNYYLNATTTNQWRAVIQYLGTGLTGRVKKITYNVKSPVLTNQYATTIICYDSSSYTTQTGCDIYGDGTNEKSATAALGNVDEYNAPLAIDTWEQKTDFVRDRNLGGGVFEYREVVFQNDKYYTLTLQQSSVIGKYYVATSSTSVLSGDFGYIDKNGYFNNVSGKDLYFTLESAYVPLTSGIDKITLYTLNNQDLSEITTPIPFDAGHQIHFFNYEEDPFHYLAYNITICHNGQLEGCTLNNETFVEDVIDISSLGFSSSGEPPLSVKINFKDVVSQSDFINITWFLTNCNNAYSTCPEGVSEVRGYTYSINNSLASDTWLTFDDPARPECSIARLDVCFINAVNYFIKPRTSGFANSFSVAHTRINERVPFIYLYAVRDAISDISNSPTAPVNWSVSFGSLGSLTVLDSDSFSASPYYSFFTSMRVYLSYLLWILLGVGLYKRAVRLFDDKTVA